MDTNSFEQLCINYANEKLHQHFLVHTFKSEQKTYQEQGINIGETIFKDNEPIVKLIEHNIDGIFACLEDEIRLPKGSDERLLSKLKSKFQSKKDIFARDIKNPNCFKILHFVSPVSYKINGFLEKAKDEISWNILEMFGDSNHPTLKRIFKRSSDLKSSDVSSMKLNIGIQYKNEMNDLLEKMDRGQLHYIKCLLANRDKRPMCFDYNIIKDQLRANGVLETVGICQKGFTVKMTIEEFAQKYKTLVQSLASKKKVTIQEIIAEIKNYDKSQLQLGKDIIFIKKDGLLILETQLKKSVEESQKQISRCSLIYTNFE